MEYLLSGLYIFGLHFDAALVLFLLLFGLSLVEAHGRGMLVALFAAQEGFTLLPATSACTCQK